MTLYFLQVSAGIVVAWGIYRLALKGRTAARTNRWFLLGGLVLPFVLPLIPLSSQVVATAEPILLPTITVNGAITALEPTPNMLNWVPLVYLGGVLAMLVYHLSSVFVFLRMFQSASRLTGSTNIYILLKTSMPFSFFGKIFLPKGLSPAQREVIIAHEQVHIRQAHSADVLLGMLVQTALWFFPLLPLYLRDLRQEHEYEVDQLMLSKTAFAPYAETLLELSLMPIHSAQFHSFSHSKLKQRIIMMTKTQKHHTWKLLMLIPLAGGMLYLNACTKQAETPPAAPDTLAMKDVDVPPQFADCATDESAEAQMQCFSGGIMNQIINNLKYPESAYEAKVEGKIFIAFVVDTKGNVTAIQVKRSISKTTTNEVAVQEMEDAATGIFKSMPKLIPAQKDGNPVSMEYVVPINFALPKE